MKLLAAHQNSPRALRYLPEEWAGASVDVVLDERGEAITALGAFIAGQLLTATLEDISRNEEFRGRRMDLAVNVRSYGLLDELSTILVGGKLNAVVYNVPGEELPAYTRSKLNVLGRLSEYEDQTRSSLIGGVLVHSLTGQREERLALVAAARAARRGTIYLISESLHDREELTNGVLRDAGVAYLITKR